MADCSVVGLQSHRLKKGESLKTKGLVDGGWWGNEPGGVWSWSCCFRGWRCFRNGLKRILGGIWEWRRMKSWEFLICVMLGKTLGPDEVEGRLMSSRWITWYWPTLSEIAAACASWSALLFWSLSIFL